MSLSDEKTLINGLLDIIKRSPDQLNKPFECDSEIIDSGEAKISISIDTLIEEAELLQEPYVIGWYAAMMTISDLLASGSKVKGILISITRSATSSDEFVKEVINGAQNCCEYHSTYILGGDMNDGSELSITTSGFGVNGTKPLMRSGVSAGEGIFVTENVGTGNAHVFLNMNQINNSSDGETELLPRLKSTEVNMVRECANSAIDTSDGLILGLLDLLNQNKEVDFYIESDKIPFHYRVHEISLRSKIPEIVFAGGEVGDYGLLFTAPLTYCEELINAGVHQIGTVRKGGGELYVNSKKVDPYGDQLLELRNKPLDYINKLTELLA